MSDHRHKSDPGRISDQRIAKLEQEVATLIQAMNSTATRLAHYEEYFARGYMPAAYVRPNG